MAKPRFTPEEQLLKLIEKEGGVQARRSPKIAWLTFRKGIDQGLAALKNYSKQPNLKTLNKFLLVICILFLVYSIADFAFTRATVKTLYRQGELSRAGLAEATLGSEAQPALHYVEIVRRRNAFSPITLAESKEGISGEQGLRKMAESLSLVGISWYEQQPLAMIEDKNENKTYFLKQGDTIKQFQIKQILKNSVILSFEDETLELM